MSYVVALPESMSAAATNVASIGSAVATANQGVAGATTRVFAAAEDEVSAAIAALFSAHGQEYQALSAQASTFSEGFVRALTCASGAYTSAEVANAALMQAAQLGRQEIQQAVSTLATGFTGVANTIATDIFGAPTHRPFPATQMGTVTGIPSLANRFDTAALWPVKPLLNLSGLSGLQAQLAAPSNPLSLLLGGNVSPLAWLTGNTPPPLLNFLLGETVQHTTYDGMPVVQITPSHPTGDYVVAIHGGGFILTPSILHWLNYSITANLTGATMVVPIYPLVWQGGTAGTVVPVMAGLISSQIATYGASNVSVIGDSAGGTLALAAVQNIVSQGGQVPKAMVLLSPWLDVGTGSFARWWAGNLPVNSYLVSPLNGSLNGLPPTYVYGLMGSTRTPGVCPPARSRSPRGPDQLHIGHRQYSRLGADPARLPIPPADKPGTRYRALIAHQARPTTHRTSSQGS